MFGPSFLAIQNRTIATGGLFFKADWLGSWVFSRLIYKEANKTI